MLFSYVIQIWMLMLDCHKIHTHTKWHRHFQMPKMNKYAFNKQNEMSQSNIVATRGNGSKKRKRKQQILNFKQTTLIWCVFFPLDCRRIGWVIDVCHAKHISGSEHENVKLLSKYIYQFRADDAQPFDLVFTRCNWKKFVQNDCIAPERMKFRIEFNLNSNPWPEMLTITNGSKMLNCY